MTQQHWTDFNSAEDPQDFDVIPNKTLAKVRMRIRPGGYDNPEHGWFDGYATHNPTTGAVYLNAEFIVLEGEYAKRHIFTLIGLYSDKGDKWAAMGRSLIKGILNSARGLRPDDVSPQAQQARCIQGFADLDGLAFIARIGVEKDQQDEARNLIRGVITPDHARYAELMGTTPLPASPPLSAYRQPTPTAPQSAPQNANTVPTRPNWVGGQP